MNETKNFTSTLNTTLSDENNLTFTDVITNPYFYGSSIIFIIIISSIITFTIILKNKSKFLFSTHS